MTTSQDILGRPPIFKKRDPEPETKPEDWRGEHLIRTPRAPKDGGHFPAGHSLKQKGRRIGKWSFR